MVVADRKYPFWRIKEEFKNAFSWMVGESMYTLDDEDVKKCREVIESIKRSNVSKSALYSIISKCNVMGKDETKFFIDSKAKAGKLGRFSRLPQDLNRLVDHFHQKYGEDWKENSSGH
jgi:hypothetical protein